MKSYDETISSVFNRVNAYAAERKRKRTVIKNMVASICCICLVAILGVWVWQSGLFVSPPPSADGGTTPTDSLVQTEPPVNTENPSNDTFNIYLNEIMRVINAAPPYLDPSKHHTANWSNQEAAEYLGVDLSNLGHGFENVGDNDHIVTYNNDGSLVRDLVGFSYKYAENEFSIAASRLTVPYDCIYTLDQNKKTPIPTANGSVDVLFAGSTNGDKDNLALIVADFENNGVYYRVKAENVSLANFSLIVKAIINNG